MSDDLPDLEPIDLGAETASTSPSAPFGAAVGSAPVGPPAVPGGDTWPMGWYADPWTAGQYRFWNGSAWTAETHRSGPAATYAGPSAWPASPAAVASVPPPSPTAPAPAEPGMRPGPPLRPTPDNPRARTVAIVVGLLVLVLLAGAIGYAIESSTRSHQSVTVAPPSQSSPGTTAPGPTVAPPTPAEQSALSKIVVRQSDVAAAREVVLIPEGNRTTQPTLDLCNGTYASEKLRVARLQVAEVNQSGAPWLSTEAVAYKNTAASELAFTELRKVSAACPHAPVKSPVGEGTAETTFNAPPDAAWPQTASVQRLAYSFVTTANGTKSASIAVYLRRGRMLLGLYFPNPAGAQSPVAGKPTVEGIVGVFAARMAALPASVVNASA